MAENKIIIAKADKFTNRLKIKVKNRARNNFSPVEYSKIANLNDSNDLCVLFEDLKIIFDAPLEKAFRKFIEKSNKGFPF
jgi:hypothetical protein